MIIRYFGHLSRGRHLVIPLAVILILGIACSPSSAAIFTNGSASVWAYTRDDSVDHVQLIPTVSLTVAQFGLKDTRFEASLRGYTDVRNGTSYERELRILRGVFIYTPEKCPWEMRLGQQWLSEGVGRGNVAGLWLRYKLDKRTKFTVYGGSRIANSVSLQEKNVYHGYALGLNVRTHLEPFNVGASYFYIGKGNGLLYHAAGLEANGRVARGLNLRGRFEMNVAQGSMERAQILADWTVRSNVTVTGEFRAQTPRIFEDSFFTLFLNEVATTFGRASARWTFYRTFYARGGGSMLFSESPDPLYKIYVAVGEKHVELGYTHWLSVSKGVMDGIFVQGHYNLSDKYDVFGGYDFSRGSNADTDLRPATDSHTAYLGGTATPIPMLSVTARAEQIRDLTHKSDWRALLGVTARFTNLR